MFGVSYPLANDLIDMEYEVGRCPERDEMFDQYLSLSRESERLKYRLSQTLPPTPYNDVFKSTGCTRKSVSPSMSPISRRASNSTTHSSSTSQSPSLSPSLSQTAFMAQQELWDTNKCPTPPMPGTTPTRGARSQDQSDEMTLKCVNQQMKAILTELLNCPSVKHDQEFRSWVQERLMDAEHEIRRQKRRQSSAEREVNRMR